MVICYNMKSGKWLVRCIIVCLASIVLCMADNSVRGKAVQDDAGHIVQSSSSAFFDCNSYFLSVPAQRCSSSRNSTSTNSLRTSYQSPRQNTSNSTRTGFTIIKAGKSMNEYSTSLFRKSIVNFPSGMNESNHHLIALRKLII